MQRCIIFFYFFIDIVYIVNILYYFITDCNMLFVLLFL